jgi:hypothetical protein
MKECTSRSRENGVKNPLSLEQKIEAIEMMEKNRWNQMQTE